MTKKKVVRQDNPDLYKLNEYYKGMEKTPVKRFVKAARFALYESPDIELDDIETILHCACIKLEAMQNSNIRKIVTKVADDLWAIAEGKADGSEKELKKLSGVLHDIRAGRDTDWYMKE